MINPQLSAADKERLKTLVLQFPRSEDGKKFTALTGVTNIREIKPNELDQLDAFVVQTRAGLAIAPLSAK